MAQKVRIAGPIQDRDTVSLRKHVHPLARPEFDRGPVDPGMKLDYVTMVLKPSDAQQADLETLLVQQQDKSSANFHRWLTPEQFGNRFGLAASDIAAAKAWISTQGFHIEDTARAKNWIAFSGTAAQVQRAFHTELHQFEVGGKRHYANATEPSIPAALAGVVHFFRGLDDFDLKAPAGIQQETPLPEYTSGSGAHSLSPDDFAVLYNLTPLYDAGINGDQQSIAILGRTDIDVPGYRTFRSLYGLPATEPVLHLVGRDPGTNSGDLGEAMLDLEWSGAVARSATIIYVYATSINTAAQEAVDKNLAPVMSMSYGLCETESPDNLRNVAQQANAQGITWMVSSGDAGASACELQGIRQLAGTGQSVNYPASLPEITGVGGTMFNEGSGTYWNATNTASGASVMSYIPEGVWNENGTSLLATGGGASANYGKPFWQSGPGVPADKARDVPDISLSAALHDGYRTYHNGSSFLTAGTSAGTPAFAGIVALLNHYQVSNGLQPAAGMGNINPVLYRLAQTFPAAFHDITSGDNVVGCVQSSPNCAAGSFGYAAGPGYDLATGLGSVDGNSLITHWNQNAMTSTTSAAAAAASIAFGAKAQLTATVAAGNGVGTPTGTVSFLVPNGMPGALTVGSAPLTVADGAASASITVDPNQLALGDNNILAVYSGDSNFDISSATVVVTVTPPANAAAIVVSFSPNPVYASATTAGGSAWFYSISLTEQAGVAATLTSFIIDGTDNSARLSTFFPNGTKIPAKGTLTTSANVTGLTTPVSRGYVFGGTDANGNSWSQTITVQFIGPLLQPVLTLAASPATVQRNPTADPACPWLQRLNVQQVGGVNMRLTKFLAGTKDLTTQISQYFGTTEIAPFGALQASMCSTGATPPAAVTYEVDGTTDGGSTVRAVFAASYAAAQAAPATLATGESTIAMSTTSMSETTTTPLAVNLDGGTSTWTASIFPANASTSWLKISPVSGTGSGTIALTANASGLVPGVYRATITVVASNAVPQFIEVPVVFTIGASSDIGIGGVTNAASFQTTVAPGMVLAVFGTGLAPSLQLARGVPLPMSMQGVSATVNGVAAPLYFMSDGQINLQVPYETGAGRAVVGINNNGKVASFSFTVAPTAPGIFVLDGNLVQTASGKAGDVLTLYMTGEGDVTPTLFTGASPSVGTPARLLPAPRLPVAVTVGGVPATVQFAGIPPTLVGTTQVNFVIPAGVAAGVQPVVVISNGVSSAAANIVVGP